MHVHLQNFLFGSVKCIYMSLFFVVYMAYFLACFCFYQSSVLVIEIIMTGDLSKKKRVCACAFVRVYVSVYVCVCVFVHVHIFTLIRAENFLISYRGEREI